MIRKMIIKDSDGYHLEYYEEKETSCEEIKPSSITIKLTYTKKKAGMLCGIQLYEYIEHSAELVE